MCTTRRCSFTSFEVQLENPSRLASRQSKPPDVDACPHTIFIHSSVLRRKSANLFPLGFEAQTKKLSQWFWGATHQTVDLGFNAQTKKVSPPILRLNREIRASRLLHVYDADRTWCELTSRSYGHQVPDLCLITADPPHQVSYSCLDPRCCLPYRILHLHITRQGNMFFHTK
jgi:hypothetical protein